ncbi:MAG: hypothetical protein ACLU4Q_06450 [Streptococcus thermophilus]
MIDSKEINKFAFPLVLTNIGQVIIGQIALHFAVNNSSIALSGISIIQNLLFAFGGLLGAFSLSFNIKSSKAYSNRQTNRFDDLLKSNLTYRFNYRSCLCGFCHYFWKCNLEAALWI